MYTRFFSLTQAPFSIAPDPRYLFMTQGHREALAHLLYGIDSGGGVVLLTGEIGAGKTTVCRCFLEQVPANCKVAYIFNPKLSVEELLQSICDEFRIAVELRHDGPATIKDYVDALTRHLLQTHAQGQNSLLIIDEAQNLSAEVLEQLRLLTNLETNERKLLQIVLIGQPELRAMLDRPELTQLAQRVIARYHLQPLKQDETASYVRFRLAIAGLTGSAPFGTRVLKQIHRLTAGVPRRINLLCDRALLGAYTEGKHEVDPSIVKRAAAEVFGRTPAPTPRRRPWMLAASLLLCAGVAGAAWVLHENLGVQPAPAQATPVAVSTAAAASAPASEDAPVAEWKDGDDPYRQLARLWKATLPEGDACSAAQAQGLNCYQSSKGMSELRQLDRPALLRLRDDAGASYQALLIGMADHTATIQVGNTARELSLVMLMRQFDGEFATFWRSPHRYFGTLSVGDRGALVDWIAEQLARVNGLPQPGPDRVYDEAMARKVREFQSAQGLRADGVTGPVTLMHLNRVAGVDEPRLRRRPSADLASQAATSAAHE